MSTEQSESAPGAVTEPQVETKAAPAADERASAPCFGAVGWNPTQQATAPTATMQRIKNPKRVAARKMGAERTRLAREEQKKAAEAYDVKAVPEATEPTATTEGESPKIGSLFGLSTNQWIGIGGICVSLLGLYYKRKELMARAKPVFD